jgi:hypothetical protein
VVWDFHPRINRMSANAIDRKPRLVLIGLRVTRIHALLETTDKNIKITCVLFRKSKRCECWPQYSPAQSFPTGQGAGFVNRLRSTVDGDDRHESAWEMMDGWMDGRRMLINKLKLMEALSSQSRSHGSKSSCPYMTNHILSMLTVVLDSPRPTQPSGHRTSARFHQLTISDVYYCSAVRRAKKKAQSAIERPANSLHMVENAGTMTVSRTPPSIKIISYNSPFAWCGVFAASELCVPFHFPPLPSPLAAAAAGTGGPHGLCVYG